MNRTELRKIFLGQLKPFFKKKGFELFSAGGAPNFVKYDGEIAISFFFNFKSDLSIRGGQISITFYSIEDIIHKVGCPDKDYTRSKKKEFYHTPTIHLVMNNSDLKIRPLLNSKEVEDFGNEYIQYFEKSAHPFIDKFSNLENVYRDLLKVDGELTQYRNLLSGGPEFLVRALLIFKMYNYPNFNIKLNEVEDIFKTKLDDEWKPFWKEYKMEIEKTQPIKTA